MEELDLFDNQIGDMGATELARALPRLTKMTEFLIVANRIGDGGKKELRAAASALPNCHRFLC